MSFIGITLYKTDSNRCPNKHFRIFDDDKTLVDLKIEQLLQSGAEHVYVSTNDKNVKSSNKITYIERKDEYCNESYHSFTETLNVIFNSIPVEDKIPAIFTTSMCPLFSRYDEMYEKFSSTKNNQLAVYPSKHYYLDSRKRGINFMPGHWEVDSQFLDAVYHVPLSGCLATMGELRQVSFYIPKTFDYFEIKFEESIDIDTEEEFLLAQHFYNIRKK